MSRNKIIMISVVVSGIVTLLAISVWLHRCPVNLRVAGVEPSNMFSFGENKAVLVTLSVSNSDNVDLVYEIPAFEASLGGHWIEWQQVPKGALISPGASDEEKLVMPEGTRCRIRIRYASASWKKRFLVAIGPPGERWVKRSRWLYKHLWPDTFELAGPTHWKTNTMEIMIPPGLH